jgi:hypothetical protein
LIFFYNSYRMFKLVEILFVKKPLIAPISLFIIDDQSYYIDDLKLAYSESGKYEIKVFSSLHRFTEHLSQQIRLKPSIRIAIISLKILNGTDSTPEKLTEKLLSVFPFLNIIKVTDEKEMPKDESYKQAGNLIYVKRNENTLLRVDNGIKRIVGKRTVELKEKQKKTAENLLYGSIALFFVVVLIVRIFYPKIFYF